MEKTFSRKDLWDAAGKAGLVLGLVSCAYLLITQLLTKGAGSTGAGFISVLFGLLLWAAKLVGCIVLMKYFMKKFAEAHPGLDNSDTFRFGLVTALLSALIFSAFNLAYFTWIMPDAYATVMENAIETYGSMLPAESIEAMEEMNFGTISFFSNLIYCFLYGTVLSAILSRSIPSSNPFAGYRQDNDTPEEQ